MSPRLLSTSKAVEDVPSMQRLVTWSLMACGSCVRSFSSALWCGSTSDQDNVGRHEAVVVARNSSIV